MFQYYNIQTKQSSLVMWLGSPFKNQPPKCLDFERFWHLKGLISDPHCTKRFVTPLTKCRSERPLQTKLQWALFLLFTRCILKQQFLFQKSRSFYEYLAFISICCTRTSKPDLFGVQQIFMIICDLEAFCLWLANITFLRSN